MAEKTMSRRLHIGGKLRSDGWEVLNAIPAPYVDYVGNATSLVQFPDNTFTDIYASHIVEHLDYADELLATLKEWHRVLKPGGHVYISVPDLDILARLFAARGQLTFDERFLIMRMIFGGHVDRYDYHVAGLNEEFLVYYLQQAGYSGIKRVQDLGYFDDTSRTKFRGVLISVNMVAEKP